MTLDIMADRKISGEASYYIVCGEGSAQAGEVRALRGTDQQLSNGPQVVDGHCSKGHLAL
jgi:hypothetical protein